LEEFELSETQEACENITENWMIYIYSTLSSMLVAISYAFLIYWSGGFIVWLSILGLFMALLLTTAGLNEYHNEVYGDE
jgi:uncharacterized membrane protein YoaK (UPF0700 family)